jgi:hypothetical protein
MTLIGNKEERTMGSFFTNSTCFHQIDELGRGSQGVEYFVEYTLKKIYHFLTQKGYLSSFQWILIENLFNRYFVTNFKETAAGGRPLSDNRKFYLNPLVTSLTSLRDSKEVVWFNGIFRTSTELIVDLALRRYFKTTHKKTLMNGCNIFKIWHRLLLNRKLRRGLARKYEGPLHSLYLHITIRILPLLSSVRATSKWTNETPKYNGVIHVCRLTENLQSVSQIMRGIVPSWELGPPQE